MVAARIKNISSFIVMDVLERAHEMERQGINIIHLEVGEPDFDAPECVKAATEKAFRDGYTHYTHSLGMVELREAICQYYFDKYHVSVDPDQIAVCSGTSPAMLAVFSALLEKSDQVIISDPHYACYPNLIKFLQAEPLAVDVYEEDGFQFRPESIKEKITARTKAILINSPSNPTGNLLSEKRMRAIAGMSPYVLSDEIYHGLVYEGTEHTMLEYTDRAFIFNGFSKLFAMTGLRLGYLIAPRQFIRAIQKFQQNFFICANAAIQIGGIAALTEAENDVIRMKKIYNQRRQYMIARLREMGFTIPIEPTGAFYIFVNARHIASNSYRLAFDILEKAHVGVAPGIDFGKNGEGFLRFCYANSMENIVEGMNRLEKYLNG